MATVKLSPGTDMDALPLDGGLSEFGISNEYFEAHNNLSYVAATGKFTFDAMSVSGTISAIDFALPDPSFRAPDIKITGLSFNATSQYFSTVVASGNFAQFLLDLLAGNDTVIGSEFSDTLRGYAGNDTLIGGGGGDDLRGGSGINTASYATAPGGVTASLFSPAINTGDAEGDTYSLIENLTGSRFNDLLEGDGNANVLSSGNGNDQLIGAVGNDTLIGGLGRDLLFGAAGADTFDFNSKSETVKGGNRDQIRDFERGPDHINLRDIDAKSGSGNQNFKWIGKSKFHDEKGELRYNDKGSTVIVQGDINGDGKADFEIFVNAGALAKGDFVL